MQVGSRARPAHAHACWWCQVLFMHRSHYTGMILTDMPKARHQRLYDIVKAVEVPLAA